jgi:hypothetical protein
MQLQRRFLGRRFSSRFRDWTDMAFDVVVESVQRSSATDFDYFISGRVCMERQRADTRPVDDETRVWA